MEQETKLTPKQKRFSEEYVVDLNGTQAAIRAGYSELTAGIIASQNLTKLNVRDYIDKLTTERTSRTEITADKVLESIAEIAFAKKGVANRDKLKALEMLAKHFRLFEQSLYQRAQVVEAVSVQVSSDVPESWMQIIDAMRPIERQRLIRTLERNIMSDEVIDVEELITEATDGKK